MACNNPKLDLANTNTYIKFGEILPIGSQDNEWKRNFGIIKGHKSGTNFPKMMCNNPQLDLLNMNAHIKFGESMSSSSQDIERKRNFGVNQGP